MNKYEIKDLSEREFRKICAVHGTKIFDEESQIIRLRDVMSEIELQNIEALERLGEPLKVYLGIYCDNEFAG